MQFNIRGKIPPSSYEKINLGATEAPLPPPAQPLPVPRLPVLVSDTLQKLGKDSPCLQIPSPLPLLTS